MKPSERIHVAPLGFEHDRVVEAAKQLKADCVILLEWGQSERPDFFEDVYTDLDAAGIEHDVRSCNIFEMYDVVRVTATIARQHPDDDVYVNISTGSKISAIGGMIACMVSDATPYYVEPEHYGNSDPSSIEPVSYGVKNIQELPAYPIDGPEEQHIYVLEYIYRHGPITKIDLIRFGQGEGKEIPSGAPSDGLPFITDFQSDSKKGRYNLLETHILKPLREKGFIEFTEVGRRTDIELTEEGENTLSAFRHLIES
jgi:hypothetical protein